MILTVVASLLLVSCARVKPIDLHDQMVPIEARKLVADAQDAVAVARVRRDEAAMRLDDRRAWRADILDRQRWKNAPSKVVDELKEMADAHVDLARIELRRADRRIDLAEAKRDLVTARTAVRHDLATYDLEKIGRWVEEEREKVREAEAELADQQVVVERATRAFWGSYADLDFTHGSPLFVTLD